MQDDKYYNIVNCMTYEGNFYSFNSNIDKDGVFEVTPIKKVMKPLAAQV